MELTGIYLPQTHPVLTVPFAHSNSKVYWSSSLLVCTSLGWRARLTLYFGFLAPVLWNVALPPQCPPGPCIPPISQQLTDLPKPLFVAWHLESVMAHTCPLDTLTWQLPCGSFTPVPSQLLHAMGSPRSRVPPRILTAELQGMLTLLLAITHLCTNSNLTTGQITIGCDNKGVIQLVQCSWSYVPCSQKHADLLQAICLAHNCCPVSLRFQYVVGHQDDLMWFEDLPLLAQLNVQADSMAKQALHVLAAQGTPLSLTLSLTPLGPSQSQISW